MKEESKNLYAAVILSVLIIFGVNHFFGLHEAPQQPKQEETPAPAVELSTTEETKPASLPLEDALAQDDRITIQTPAVTGSIRLKGARFIDCKRKRSKHLESRIGNKTTLYFLV